MPSPTPTPPGTPTQVFVRFVGERPEGIECQIGCDGEENAPPKTRKAMALVAHSIAAAFIVGGDAGAPSRNGKVEPPREGGNEMTDQNWTLVLADGAVVVPHTGYAENAALIVDAVNAFALSADQELVEKHCDKKIAEIRDRLREELESARVKAASEKRWADEYSEECNRLRGLVRRLLMLRRGDIAVPMDMEKQILREARAAIGEDNP